MSAASLKIEASSLSVTAQAVPKNAYPLNSPAPLPTASTYATHNNSAIWLLTALVDSGRGFHLCCFRTLDSNPEPEIA